MIDGTVVQTDLGEPLEERTYVPLPRMAASEGLFVWTSISPDGLWLAGHRATGDDSSIPGAVIFSMERQEYSVITDRGVFPLWLSDSRRLIFLDEGELHIVDRATDRTQDLGFSEEQWNAWEGYTLSSDDLVLYYSKADVESDIWQATIQ
jgi:hypothetical protein